MSHEYDTRRPAETKAPEGQRIDSGAFDSGPSMDALYTGMARPSQRQMGDRVDLPGAIRAKFENSFGADLSAVKLYRSQAVADAGAEAVTQGNNIAFAPGMLDFTSHGGQALLGHEISHVVSQARGEVSGSGFLADSALEARADREGAMAAAGQAVTAPAMPAASLSPATAAPAAGPMQAKKNRDREEEEEEEEVDEEELERQRQIARQKQISQQIKAEKEAEGKRQRQNKIEFEDALDAKGTMDKISRAQGEGFMENYQAYANQKKSYNDLLAKLRSGDSSAEDFESAKSAKAEMDRMNGESGDFEEYYRKKSIYDAFVKNAQAESFGDGKNTEEYAKRQEEARNGSYNHKSRYGLVKNDLRKLHVRQMNRQGEGRDLSRQEQVRLNNLRELMKTISPGQTGIEDFEQLNKPKYMKRSKHAAISKNDSDYESTFI